MSVETHCISEILINMLSNSSYHIWKKSFKKKFNFLAATKYFAQMGQTFMGTTLLGLAGYIRFQILFHG